MFVGRLAALFEAARAFGPLVPLSPDEAEAERARWLDACERGDFEWPEES
jgi:hypothetical protein